LGSAAFVTMPVNPSTNEHYLVRIAGFMRSFPSRSGSQPINAACPQGVANKSRQETWQLAVQPEIGTNLPSHRFREKGSGNPSQLGIPAESLSSAESSWQVA
jgi:hypothetical protein